MRRPRVYEIEEGLFRETVADSLSLREVIRRLGLHDHSNTYARLRRRIEDLAIQTSHFRGGGRRPRRYTEDELRNAVKISRSFRQTLLCLGIRAEGGNYKTVRGDIERLGIDTRHFTSRGWRKGDTHPITPPRELKDILVRRSPVNTTHIKKRLLREGLLESRCAICGLNEWRGKPITIELDHINGIHDDHRLENLRMLCPNCHSQTDTFRARNRRVSHASQPSQLSIL